MKAKRTLTQTSSFIFFCPECDEALEAKTDGSLVCVNPECLWDHQTPPSYFDSQKSASSRVGLGIKLAMSALVLMALFTIFVSWAVDTTTIDNGEIGVKETYNEFDEVLDPGSYTSVSLIDSSDIEVVDLERAAIIVSGEDLLTSDLSIVEVEVVADYNLTMPTEETWVKYSPYYKSEENSQRAVRSHTRIALKKCTGEHTLASILESQEEYEVCLMEALAEFIGEPFQVEDVFLVTVTLTDKP